MYSEKISADIRQKKYKLIPELKTSSPNLEFGIINEFLIMENNSETLIDFEDKTGFV